MSPSLADGAISAHGLGGAKDLPIPSELAIAGAIAALAGTGRRRPGARHGVFLHVYPGSTDLGPVRPWAAAYFGIMVIGSALFGTTFLARADPFEVYS